MDRFPGVNFLKIFMEVLLNGLQYLLMLLVKEHVMIVQLLLL